MYIVEYIENLYANSRYGSADYEIACYILMNLERIQDISLSEIARSVGCPKSTVSYFFSSPGIPGGYSAFQRALQTEFGIKKTTVGKHVDWIRELVSGLARYKVFSDTNIRFLCSEVMKSQKVLVTGPLRYRDCFMSLIYFLRSMGIYARFIIDSDMNNAGDLFETVTERKMILFIAPSDTYTEFIYKFDSSPQYADACSRIEGSKYYLCRKNDSGSSNRNILTFRPKANPYEWVLSVMILANEMFAECVSQSETDMNRAVYIL